MATIEDFLQAMSNSAASNVSAPVDGINWLLGKAGLPVSNTPFMGSKWLEDKGLTKPVSQNAASLMGETAGMIAPFTVAAKAPQIAKGLLQAGENAMAPATLNKQAGALVWHGSPHKFDKFDSSKIGTGEGAQAYGHGLYLAENPSVAREYQEKLSSVGGAKNLAAQYGDIDKGIAEAQRRIANYKELISNGGGGMPEKAKSMLALSEKNLQDLSAMKAGLPENTGALYKVDLPDEHIAKMLDWDKPLSQQHPDVQKMLEPLGYKYNAQAAATHDDALLGALFGDAGASIPKMPHNPMGADIARGKGIFDHPQDSVIAEKLKQAGIPGIRYLDGGSRGTGQGTSNFVVFPGNEGLLKILERNGQALK